MPRPSLNLTPEQMLTRKRKRSREAMRTKRLQKKIADYRLHMKILLPL